MIDRKTFWTAMAFVALMLAAAVWRMSLLPDWTQLPRQDLQGAALPPVNSVWLLVSPGAVLFVMATLAWRTRTARNAGDALRPWAKWVDFFLVPYSLILALMQAFIIARSLGLLTGMNVELFVRGGFVALGVLTMVMNNALPKLPWLGSRIAILDMDPDRGARLTRLRAWLGFSIGLVAVLGGLFLPLKDVPPIIFSLAIAGVIVKLFFRFSARRGHLQ